MAISRFFNICSGSLGNLVFCTRNGKTYVRTKPVTVKKSYSPAQLATQQRFKLMMEFQRKFILPIRITFAPAAGKNRNPFQVALSYNLLHGFAGEYPNQQIDKSKILLSQGRLPITTPFSLKIHPEGFLIEWELGYEGSTSAADDMLVVMVLSDGNSACSYMFTEATRHSRQYLWKTKEPVSPDALPDVWVAFSNRWMTQMSNSRKLTFSEE